MDAWKEYGAGCAAGIATVITGHPFDTIKVKLQTQNTEAHSHKYRNALHCTSHILRTEGVKGLYTGATSSFAGMAMESSLLFGVYSQMKLALQCVVYVCGPDAIIFGMVVLWKGRRSWQRQAQTSDCCSFCGFWWSINKFCTVPSRVDKDCKFRRMTTGN